MAPGVTKWLRRYEDRGEPGLADRSSAPNRSPAGAPTDEATRIEDLRRTHK